MKMFSLCLQAFLNVMPVRFLGRVAGALLLLLSVTEPLAGQSIRADSSRIARDTTTLVVRRIRFNGNDHVGRSFLWRTLRTRSNREFLSIPGFTPWYWAWKRNPKSGEPPAYLIKTVLAKDVERIRAYYQSIGFFSVTVASRVTEFHPGKTEIAFDIVENQPSYIRNMSYSGIPDTIPEPDVRRFIRQIPADITLIDDTSFAYKRRYNAEFINLEQNRLVQFLRDHGYASVSRDSVRARVIPDPENPYQLDIVFLVKTGRPYTFGPVNIDITSPTGLQRFTSADTVFSKQDSSVVAIIRKADGAHIRNYVALNQVRIAPRSAYSHKRYIETINRFQGIRSLRLKRFNQSADGSLPNFTVSDTIPTFFELSTVPKYQLGAELFGMQRVGFGAGAGVRFVNNNIFRRAHRVELGLNGNFEYVSRTNQLLRSLDATIDYTIPNMSFPFNWLDEQNRFLFSETQFQIGLSQVNQMNFDINANLRLNWRFNMTHSASRRSTVDFVELDMLDASPTDEFRTELDELVLSGRIDDLQKNLILNDYLPQANSSFRYTYRDITTNVIKRENGHYYEWSAEFGGNFPWLSDRYLVTPGVMEGHLPSPVGSANNLTYTQFVKFTADHRQYVPLNDITVLAMRAFGGVAYPYGGNLQLPINRRFFAGGSNDIRGWFPLRLGPGALQDQSAINGGDVKLLTSAELRSTLARDFLASTWILSLFSDAGNVWQSPRNAALPETEFSFDSFHKQIAVGAGYGLRIDWEFVVFRVEVAYRMHDLQAGWFAKTHLIRDGNLQFGIGHAF
jgi:outer membrane protein assembly factor BamA